MNLQMIKETKKLTGDVWYSVECDGRYMDGSVTQDIEEAKNTFSHLQNQALKYPENKREVLESVTIVNSAS